MTRFSTTFPSSIFSECCVTYLYVRSVPVWTRRPYHGCKRISVPESWELFSPPDIWSNSALGSRKFPRMFVFREPPKNIGRTFFSVWRHGPHKKFRLWFRLWSELLTSKESVSASIFGSRCFFLDQYSPMKPERWIIVHQCCFLMNTIYLCDLA